MGKENIVITYGIIEQFNRRRMFMGYSAVQRAAANSHDIARCVPTQWRRRAINIHVASLSNYLLVHFRQQFMVQ